MKKYLITLFLFLGMLPSISWAATPDSLKTTKPPTIKDMVNILRVTNDENTRIKICEGLKRHSDRNHPYAMNALALAYAQGRGVDKNLETSRQLLIKASDLGNYDATYNLAMIYRRGIGVEQDFGKAFEYLNKAIYRKNPDSQALYSVAYFYYKGLGVAQSYPDAIKYFQLAANRGHKGSMHMLGLCYSNGYGVTRDLAQANYWFVKASQKGFKRSKIQMELLSPERPLKPIMLRSLALSSEEKKLEKMKKVEHNLKTPEMLDGKYQGVLITYDWSGQYVIEETPLEVDFERDGNELEVSWKQDDVSSIKASAYLTDSALIFTKGVYIKHDTIGGSKPREWEFIQTTLRPTIENNTINLAGNIQFYSPEIREPGKPMYLVLKSEQASTFATSGIEDNIVRNLDISIYPNPFKDYLNISFLQEEEATASVQIYSMSGGMLYEQKLGLVPIGKHLYQIDLNVPEGAYILKLVNGKNTHTSIITK